MIKVVRAYILTMAGSLALAVASPPGPIDGQNIPSDFAGVTPVLQNNHTGFGDYQISYGATLPGSETDELFLAGSSTHLYVGITGNLETSGHAWMICIGDPTRVGQGENRTEGVGGPPTTLQDAAREIAIDDGGTPEDPSDDTWSYGAGGMIFPCDTDYVIAVDTYAGWAHFSLYTLHDPNGAPVGTVDPTPDNPADPLLNVYAERLYVADTELNDGDALLNEQNYSGFTTGGFDNSNLLGVTDTDGSTAATAGTGLELAVPLAALGLSPGDTIYIYVLMLNGAGGTGNGTVVNQVLPPLTSGSSCDPPGEVGKRVDLIAVMNCLTVNLAALPAFNGLADGVLVDSNYGNLRQALQTCPTPYGDQVYDPDLPVRTGGSELDALYVTTDGNSLYLGITGNLKEANEGHRLNIWIDSVAGGENTVNWDPMWGTPGSGMEGDTLPPRADQVTDVFFDYVISLNIWPGPPNGYVFVDLWDLQNDSTSNRGNCVMESGSGTLANGNNRWDMQVALDNRNTAGVAGCGYYEEPCWYDADTAVKALAGTATSGTEIRVPLPDIGIDPCGGPATVHLWANITDKSGWRSNQTLPPLRGTDQAAVWNPSDLVTDWFVDEYVLPETYYRAVAYTVTFTPGAVEIDCNENGIEDYCDILSGFSYDRNINGVPDECEVPAECHIVSSDPVSGWIDARVPVRPTPPYVPMGWTEVQITFNTECDAGALTEDNFELSETCLPGACDGMPPGVLSVSSSGNVATVTLTDPIDPKTWTTLSLLGGAPTDKVVLGFLPADSDGSRTANANDIVQVINRINEAFGGGTPAPHQSDINRSGIITVADLVTLINLLNGSSPYPEAYFNKRLPSMP
ncbi:MAG TPA: hypothetical protein PKK06_14140 [Phycisphaerae bacterium]|nr:hypothetical protein [Phycisphaerae bacterium]HNU46430.1 hypothetical protein [Phycisphaerae bacterium]